MNARTGMIPVLRSIDSLLNRFDELSQRHANFASNFSTNLPDRPNPLRNVARDEEEQRKSITNLSLAASEAARDSGPIETLSDFNRRMTKSRCLNRPPSYSSNDSSTLFHRIPSAKSWGTTESAPPLRNSTLSMIQSTMKPGTPQSLPPTFISIPIESKVKSTARNNPTVLSPNHPTPRRPERSPITKFTLETAIRLAKHKTYHQSPNQKISPQRVHRRAKSHHPHHHRRQSKDVIKPPASAPAPPPPPQIKRSNLSPIKPSPKKLKIDHKVSVEKQKKTSTSVRQPLVFVAPAPTIQLTFPMQPQQRSSRFVVMPMSASKKTTGNKRPLASAMNRMINLFV